MHKFSLGFVGLGRMGLPMSQRLQQNLKDTFIAGFDSSEQCRHEASKNLLHCSESLEQLISQCRQKNAKVIVWLMIPAQTITQTLEQLAPLLKPGDIVIDGGNTAYADALAHQQKLQSYKLHYVSIGCSGGTKGAAMGPPMTVSCVQAVYDLITPILRALSDNISFYPQSGFGHLAKNIHNAIEYGMMQSIAEGVALYYHYGFSQQQILDTFKTWSKGSIIESALVHCVVECLETYDFSLPRTIANSETVHALQAICDVPLNTPAIDAAIDSRLDPAQIDEKSLTTLALMRNIFGGHKIL